MSTSITAANPNAQPANGATRAIQAIWHSVRTRWDVYILVIAVVGYLFFESTTLNGISNSYDEGVYWQSLQNLAGGHPLFSSVFSSQPPLFLLSVLPFYLLAGQTLAAAKIAIVAYGAVGLVTTWWLGRRLGGPIGATLACALLVTEDTYVLVSRRVDAEVPSVAVTLVAVALAEVSTQYMGRNRRRVLIALSGIFCVLAIMIKFFALVALAPVVAFIAAPYFRSLLDDGWRLGTTHRLFAVQLLKDLGILAGAVVATLVLVLLPFADRLNLLYDQTVQFHVAAGLSAREPWQNALTFIVKNEWAQMFFREALIALALLAIIPARHRLLRLAPIVLWLILCFAELVQQRPIFPRHFVILSPLLAIIIGTGVSLLARGALRDINGLQANGLRSARALGPALRVVVTVAFTALVLITCGRNLQRTARDLHSAATAQLTGTQQAMIHSLEANVPPNSLVISDDQYVVSLANREVPPELVDTSAVRVGAGFLTAEDLETIATKDHVSAILFSTGRLTSIAGFQTWVEQRYTLVQQFGNGQALYLLNPVSKPGLKYRTALHSRGPATRA